jgi:hypothetical protein
MRRLRKYATARRVRICEERSACPHRGTPAVPQRWTGSSSLISVVLMYGTCLFCNRPLGENAALEEFPVGRRLAFDAVKGRLWVVCGKCERWNLSPIEERWEAIEACERIFRDTRMRVSTDNIGMARLPEGLELVRIGAPMRPEFAAWRYGDQFGRRRKRAVLYAVGAVAVIGGITVGGLAVGVISGSLLAQSGNFVNLWMNGRTRLRLPTAEGKVLKLKQPDLQGARLRPGDHPDEWSVILGKGDKERAFKGEDAGRVAGLIMPKINSSGARSSSVQEAVRAIESAGGPDPYLHSVIRRPAHLWTDEKATIGKLAVPTKLALEMALHEEQERSALEGELKALELAWKAAEEVAGIADDLLLTEETQAFLARYQERTDGGAG